MINFVRAYLIILILLAGVILLGSTANAEGPVKLTYYVTVSPGDNGQVKAVMEGLDGSAVNFLMSTVDQTDLKGNISDFTAVGEDGSKLPVSAGSNGWNVNLSGNERITVSYEFGAEFIQQSGRDWSFVNIGDIYGLIYNEAIFVFPDPEPDLIYVEYELPEDWGVATHFQPEGNNSYQVEGTPGFKEELLYNATRLGEIHHQVTREYEDITLSFFAFQPPTPNHGLNEFWRPHYGTTPKEEMGKYLDMVYEIIQELKQVFGFWPGGNQYIVTTISEGDYLHSLTGFEHWMQAWTRERHPDVHHHVAHAWVWWDKIELEKVQENWVGEGVPMYYQGELPARMTGDDMWQGLHYVHHLIIERADQFNIMDQHTIQVYAQDYMRVLALDREIQENTGGRKGLDDLMHYLAREYEKGNMPFSHSQMIQAINDISGTDLSDFYNRYMIGQISRELPPVAEFIDEYREPFFKWVDTYIETPGNMSGGSRAMFFIALELAIHSQHEHFNEHSVAGRANPYHLRDFRELISNYDPPFNEDEIIEVLSQATGVNQEDFFDFYSIGNYRPNPDEVTDWYNNPPPSEEVYAPIIEDRSIAYIEPSAVETGVPTELKMVVKDEELVSDEGYVRVGVELDGSDNLGTVLHDLDHYIEVDDFELNGTLKNFEAGLVHGNQYDGLWEGSFVVTIPDNFLKMQIQAEHEADKHYKLAIWVTEPANENEVEEEAPEEVEQISEEDEPETEVDEAFNFPAVIVGIFIVIALTIVFTVWRKKRKQ